MSGFAGWVLRNRIGLLLGFGFLLPLGAWALLSIPVALLPRYREPVLTIQTEYHGVAPRMVEEVITRPLESLLEETPGIQELYAVSTRGRSRILVRLHREADVDTAAVMIRDRVRHAAERFPSEARQPALYTYDTDDRPVLIAALGVNAPGVHGLGVNAPVAPGGPPELDGCTGQARLTGLVERRIKPRLLSIEGVANVEIAGGSRQEYLVDLYGPVLAEMRVSCQDLFQAVASGCAEFSPGSLRTFNSRIPVRFSAGYPDLQGLPAAAYRLNGSLVPGAELFTVRRREREEERLSLVDNRDTLALYVFKKHDAGILAIDRGVRRVLERTAPGTDSRIITSQAEGFRVLLRQLYLGLAAAVVSVFLVVLLFYRRPGHALLILVTVPLCIAGTVTALRLLSRSLNIMTLSGIVVGMGTCVDATILMVDGMLRAAAEPGADPRTARAIRKIIRPLCSSTLTTVVVFLPLFLIGEGEVSWAGALYADFALSLSVMLVVSCAAALFFVPALVVEAPPPSTCTRRLDLLQHSELRTRYGLQLGGGRLLAGMIRCSVRRPWPVVLAFIAVSGAGCWLFLTRPLEEIPPLAGNEYRAFFEFEPRFNAGYQREALQELGREVLSLGLPAVLVSRLDQGRATLLLKFPLGHRFFDRDVAALQEHLAGLRRRDGFFHFEPRGATGTRSMVVSLYGDNLEGLNRVADQISSQVLVLPGVQQVLKGYREGKPEIRILPDRQRMYARDLNPVQVARFLRYLFHQPVIFKQYEDGRLVDVRGGVSLPDLSWDRLHLVRVPNQRGEHTALGDFVSISYGRAPGALSRRNGKRFISLDVRYQGVREETMVRDLDRLLRRALSGAAQPAHDVFAELDSELRERVASRRGFILTAGLALFLVYVTVGAVQKSFAVPLLILATIPGIFVGSSLFLLAGGFGRSVPAHLALIMMVGLSVNSVILLAGAVTAARTRHPGASGVSEALLAGYAATGRLIGVTLLTTTCSLLPVYFLATATAFFKVLTGALFFGSLAGTLLALSVFPALYRLMPGIGSESMNPPGPGTYAVKPGKGAAR
jgi:HAE1 family hydrophobic/amphiphilic exporter-1